MKKNKSANYKLTFFEKIMYGLLFAVTYSISLLPFCVLYTISDGIYLLAYKGIGYRRKVVRKNLTESFPEKSEEEIKVIEKKFYHFLCDYFVESVKLLSISEKEIRRRMLFKNFELVNEVANQGRSVTAYISHYGNWEWISSVGLYTNENHYVGQVYHILENRVFDKFFLNLRQRFGSHSVAMGDILRRTIECHQAGIPILMGYIADQVPEWHNIHHWVDFLNHYTPVITGTERIAKKFNDRVVYFDVTRPKRGYYVLEVKLMTDTPNDFEGWGLTEEYFKFLEEAIKKQPELWLWSHNRWKRTYEGYIRWKNGGGDDLGKKKH